MPRANLGAGQESLRSGEPAGSSFHLPRPSTEVSVRLLSGRAGTDQIILMPVPNVPVVQPLRSVQVVKIADATARFNRSTVHEPMTPRQSPSILKESAVKNCDTLFVTTCLSCSRATGSKRLKAHFSRSVSGVISGVKLLRLNFLRPFPSQPECAIHVRHVRSSLYVNKIAAQV
jgi:hypothetical protein